MNGNIPGGVDSRPYGRYHGIMTHVPAGPIEPYTEDFARVRKMPWEEATAFMYRPSLLNLESLRKKFPGAQIIAYTGAGSYSVHDDMLLGLGVSLVIRRKTPSDDSRIKEDLGQILAVLEQKD